QAPVAPQGGGRVHLDERLADDPDPVAEALRLVEVVRADHDRASGVAETADEVADVLGRGWIERARRLVEVDDLRLVEQGARDGYLLAHPLAESRNPPVPHLRELHDAEVVVDRSPQGRAGQPVQPAVVAQVLAGRELVVQAGRLGQDAADGADAPRFGAKAHAVDPRGAGRRHHQTREHPNGGRLAGTIRPEQPEDLTVTDGEAQVLHRLERAEALAEALHLDHGTSPDQPGSAAPHSSRHVREGPSGTMVAPSATGEPPDRCLSGRWRAGVPSSGACYAVASTTSPSTTDGGRPEKSSSIPARSPCWPGTASGLRSSASGATRQEGRCWRSRPGRSSPARTPRRRPCASSSRRPSWRPMRGTGALPSS